MSEGEARRSELVAALTSDSNEGRACDGRGPMRAKLGVRRIQDIVRELGAFAQVDASQPAILDVNALVVTGPNREAGVGRALLERVHNWALRRGLDDVCLRQAGRRGLGGR